MIIKIVVFKLSKQIITFECPFSVILNLIQDLAPAKQSGLFRWIECLAEKRGAFLKNLSACEYGRKALINLGYRQDA